MLVSVAIAQMNCKLGDVDKNLQRIEKIAQKASTRDPDIVCFPELVTTGYSLNERWRDLAETVPGPSTERLGRISSQSGFCLIAGMPERDPKTNRIYNSAVLLDPDDGVVGVYRKVHLWGSEREYFTAGDRFKTYRTKFGTIGIGICYDLEFPEATRIMAIKGADVVFFPSAEMKPFEKYIETYVRSRAAENCVFVAFANRIGREGETIFFGHSQVVSPACSPLARVASSEGFALARIDLADLSKQRERFPYLMHRVPAVYEGLGSQQA